MKQNMRKDSESAKKGHTGSTELKKKRMHKDWRFWLAVILMLAAIIIYVLSLDDSLLAFGIGSSVKG